VFQALYVDSKLRFREGRRKGERRQRGGRRRGQAHLNVVGDLQDQHSVARPELDVVSSLMGEKKRVSSVCRSESFSCEPLLGKQGRAEGKEGKGVSSRRREGEVV